MYADATDTSDIASPGSVFCCPFASVVVVATMAPVVGFSRATVTPAMGASPVLLLSRSSRTVPLMLPALATMPASQLRSDSPESRTVWTVLPVAVSASLSVRSVPAAASFAVKA